MRVFDPKQWREVKTNAWQPAPKGPLRLRCSKEAAIFIRTFREVVDAETGEVSSNEGVLAEVGTEVNLSLGQRSEFLVEAPKGARAFLNVPAQAAIRSKGEIFTNADRAPAESGTLAEVQRGLRMLELARRQAEREAAQALRDIKRARRPKPAPQPDAETGGEVQADPPAQGGAE